MPTPPPGEEPRCAFLRAVSDTSDEGRPCGLTADAPRHDPSWYARFEHHFTRAPHTDAAPEPVRQPESGRRERIEAQLSVLLTLAEGKRNVATDFALSMAVDALLEMFEEEVAKAYRRELGGHGWRAGNGRTSEENFERAVQERVRSHFAIDGAEEVLTP